MNHFADHILHLHGFVAVALIFAVPALEASVFVGFVFPGEIAAILGGVLASQHRINLAVAVVAVVAGAIIGNGVGYFVGRRAGAWLFNGPLSRWVRADHVERAQDMIYKRGAWAVLLGRWAAGLRVLVPGAAGMAAIPFGKFMLFSAIGGAIWGTTMVLAGWAAGSHWHTLAHTFGAVGLGIFAAVIAAAVVAGVVLRRRRASSGARGRSS